MFLLSFPMRERGLKSDKKLLTAASYSVVPHAGTWIEIYRLQSMGYLPLSFPMRERGLKSQIP